MLGSRRAVTLENFWVSIAFDANWKGRSGTVVHGRIWCEQQEPEYVLMVWEG